MVARAGVVERLAEVRHLALLRVLQRVPERERDRHLLPDRHVGVEDRLRPAEQRPLARVGERRGQERSDQREPEDEPGVPGGDRDRAAPYDPGVLVERDAGEHRHRQPDPEPAEPERDRDHHVRDPRQQRELEQACTEQERASADDGDRADPAADRPSGERRGRQGADDECTGDRLEPPDGDHEQHGEEERADERREDERERRVGGECPVPAPAVLLSGHRDRACRGGEQRSACERRLHDEDRPPVEELRQDAAQHRPERRAEHRHLRPERNPGLPSAGEPAEERDRRRQHERRAEPLDAAEGDQHRQVHRGGAADRRGGEEDEPHLRDAARVEPPGEEGDHRRGDRDDEVVRGDHPRDADERRVERAVEVGQREDDDRRVGERDCHRRRHRPVSQGGDQAGGRSIRRSPGSPKPNRR